MNDILGDLNEMFEEALEGADTSTLGQKLQAKRESLKLKLVDIARITGLSESLIWKIESDKLDDIKISTMKKLSLVYDVSPQVFIAHLGQDASLAQIQQKAHAIANARTIFHESKNGEFDINKALTKKDVGTVIKVNLVKK